MPRNSTPARNTSVASKASFPVTRASPTSPSIGQAPQASMGTVIKEGFGFGMGSAIAHRMVGSFFPSNGTVAAAPPPPREAEWVEPCKTERRIFENCLISESEFFCHNQQDTLTTCLKIHANSSETK